MLEISFSIIKLLNNVKYDTNLITLDKLQYQKETFGSKARVCVHFEKMSFYMADINHSWPLSLIYFDRRMRPLRNLENCSYILRGFEPTFSAVQRLGRYRPFVAFVL
jgi:hypothetical protein